MSTSPTTSAKQTSAADQAIVVATGLRKIYRIGESRLEILKGVDISVRPGEFVAIEGRSGSGKSTLLHILGALDSYEEGTVAFDGKDLKSLGATGRSRLRNTQLGFVFQFYHLLPELNVLENTMLAAMVEKSLLAFGAAKANLRQRAIELLTEMGLENRLRHRPQQLSGGERQRVAIARALMNQPRVLFADEPTGNLDDDTGRQIMDLLGRLHSQSRQTIIMVTHDRTLARTANRVLLLEAGKLRQTE